MLISGGFVQTVESFADRLFGEGRNPQPLDRTLCSGLLHNPALDKLALLPGIAAVHNQVSILHQPLYHLKLSLVSLVLYELYAEARRNHRKSGQRPRTPAGVVVVRLLEGAQVAECPGHLVAVALKVAGLLEFGSEDIGDFPRHAWLLGNTNDHSARLPSCIIGDAIPNSRSLCAFPYI